MQSTWNARSNFMVTYHKEIIMLVINSYRFGFWELADSRTCMYYDKK